METGGPANSGRPERGDTGLRWYQYTLRSVFVLTGVTAVFFCVARTLGYVDAVVSLAAFGVLVGTMRYPRPVHLTAGVILCGYCWNALVGEPAAHQMARRIPACYSYGVGPYNSGNVLRGWPLSPCMVCLDGLKFDTSDSSVHWALVIDGVVFAVALFCKGRC